MAAYKGTGHTVKEELKYVEETIREGLATRLLGDPLTPEAIAVLRDEVESVARQIIADVSLHSYTNDIHVECEHEGQTGVLKFSVSDNNARGQAVIQRWLDTVDKL